MTNGRFYGVKRMLALMQLNPCARVCVKREARGGCATNARHAACLNNAKIYLILII